MATTQTQIRRGTAAQCNLLTPADGEIIYDQTNDRLRIGDGAIAGGIQLPNIADIQGGKVVTATDTGTQNHVVVALTPDPGAPSNGSTVVVKILNTNNGASDLNLNAHGAVSITKPTLAGPAALSGGELVAGTFVVFRHDGTNWQMEGGVGGLSGVASTNSSITVNVAGGIAAIDINTNNAGGIGTTISAGWSGGSNLANGATTSGANLYTIAIGTGVGKTLGLEAAIGYGTWRNVTGITLGAASGGGNGRVVIGSFIRVS